MGVFHMYSYIGVNGACCFEWHWPFTTCCWRCLWILLLIH